MTTLEIVLIVLVWLGYGLFAAYQSKGLQFKDNWQWFAYPLLAPLVFVIKALYGLFKVYK